MSCPGKLALVLLVLLVLPLFPVNASAQAVVLKKGFVDAIKNRATVDVTFRVDDFSKIHSISDNGNDGDIHIGGRSEQLGLPAVAEIMNARQAAQTPAVQRVRTNKGNDQGMRLAGVWRLWFEHPPASGDSQVQFQEDAGPTDSNPPHVFEIHPVTQAGELQVLGSLARIPGFVAYEADRAFGRYEGLRMRVQSSQGAIIMASSKIGFNYVQFVMRLRQKPWNVPDGLMALADVFDSEGNRVITRRVPRMVLVAGSEPAAKVRNLGKGDELHVLGIPRVNLQAVAVVAKNAQQEREIWLPYEIIVVAVFPE